MNKRYIEGRQQKKRNFEELGWYFIHSDSFWQLFEQSASLLSDTVDYLNTFNGKKHENPLNEIIHARDSMLLTSRLVQLVSWLFVHRAVREGRISLKQAYLKENRIRITPMPETQNIVQIGSEKEIQALKERVEGLLRRVGKIDAALERSIYRGLNDQNTQQDQSKTFDGDIMSEIARLKKELQKDSF